VIRHIVLFKLKEHAEGASKKENARAVKTKLEALRGEIPGLIDLDVAIELEQLDAMYDVVLNALFESRGALAAYQVHPAHRAAAEFVGRVRESRSVIDYDTEQGALSGSGAQSSGVGLWSEAQLLALSRAFQEARVLLSGAELDLFTRLASAPETASELASKIPADERALTMLLDALVAIGLLVKQSGTYSTEPSAAELLATGRAGSVLPMILHNANLWGRWGALTRLVAGPLPEKTLGEQWLSSFIGAMHVIATPLAARIVGWVGAGNSRHLLDVGGASGTYTIAFLSTSPGMRATLFDRPPVVELAKKVLGDAGVLDRVTLVAGDFYADPFPTGHDLVFVSAIIHQNSPSENVKLFRKAFAALEPGGRIVVRDHVLSTSRAEPKSGALFAINMLVAENGGNSYTLDEIAAALSEAGFVRPRLLHPDQCMDGLVEAFRPE
jgi:SAM-dependent methyltransferase